MRNAHDLGVFESLEKVWDMYPFGGCPGDFVTVTGEVIYWNDERRVWGDASDIVSSKDNQHVEGNLLVDGDLTIGGDTKGRNASFKKLNVDNLEVANSPYADKEHDHDGAYAKKKHKHDVSDINGFDGDDVILPGTIEKAKHSDMAHDLDEDSPVYEKVLRNDRPELTDYLMRLLGGLIVKGGLEVQGGAVIDSLLSDLLYSQNFKSGALGTGMQFKVDPETGKSYAEVDELFVRMKAIFTELVIKELSHVGGEIILTPARMRCIRVEELSSVYRCYFRATDGERTIYNDFVVGDQARCQTFNIKPGVHQNVSNRYYWRLVTGIGDDYIDLSKTDCDANSDIPVAGDDICHLGNRTNTERQNAQVLSSIGNTPSFKQYVGIDSYSLAGKEETRLKPGDNELSGVVHVKNGSTGAGNLIDLPEEVQKAADLGSVNLLRNSGFTGQYENEELSPDTVLSPDAELYNKKLANWTGIATVKEDTETVSGYSATLGSLSQNLKLIIGENYVVSYKASGADVAISCGNYSVSQPLTATRTRYVHKFKFTGNQLFLVSGAAILCDLKLERGSIATDWEPSPLDNDKSMAEMQSLSYIQDAIKNGSIDMIGGLMLANMIMTGNYKDGVMQKTTAGMSGVYNDDDDVAFWGGGTFEQAIRTVMFYKDNPTATPTDEELKIMAKFAVTHGGRAILNDVIVRGYVYALGGLFSGTVVCYNGIFKGSLASPFNYDTIDYVPELTIDGDSIVIELNGENEQVSWYPTKSISAAENNGRQFKIYVDAPHNTENAFNISFSQPEPSCTHFKANGMYEKYDTLRALKTTLISFVMVPRRDGICDLFIENFNPDCMELSFSKTKQ